MRISHLLNRYPSPYKEFRACAARYVLLSLPQPLRENARTWRFIVTPSVTLPKGTLLKFDIGSRGRVIDWEVPTPTSKTNANIIWAEIEGGKTLTPKAVAIPNSIVPHFEFTLPSEVAAGKKITIALGTPQAAKEEKNGNLSQLTIQRRRPFYLYIDPTGKRQYSDPEIFTIDIKGNTLHTIRILAPSVAVKNKRFDVILRFEDRFGNLTNNAPEDTLIEFTHENLRDSLKWRLFLPETGFIALPNLYFNEPGVYAILLKNLRPVRNFDRARLNASLLKRKTSSGAPFTGSQNGLTLARISKIAFATSGMRSP